MTIAAGFQQYRRQGPDTELDCSEVRFVIKICTLQAKHVKYKSFILTYDMISFFTQRTLDY